MSSVSESKYIRNADGHYVCPHCPKVCEKQNTMYYHMKKNHENDLKYECKLCTDCPKFMQKSGFLHHLATVHPDNPHPGEEKNPYASVKHDCPECDHTTHTKSNLLIHYARTHCKTWIPTYSKTDPCPGCRKTFASSSAYLYHAIGCFEHAATTDQLIVISRIK